MSRHLSRKPKHYETSVEGPTPQKMARIEWQKHHASQRKSKLVEEKQKFRERAGNKLIKFTAKSKQNFINEETWTIQAPSWSWKPQKLKGKLCSSERAERELLPRERFAGLFIFVYPETQRSSSGRNYANLRCALNAAFNRSSFVRELQVFFSSKDCFVGLSAFAETGQQGEMSAGCDLSPPTGGLCLLAEKYCGKSDGRQRKLNGNPG